MSDTASLGPGEPAAGAPPPAEETRAALDALLASSAFDTTPRLRDFLRYICDLTLAGQGARINEYLIGREVFGRDESYSPSEDGVVRRQAHALRQKLLKYYATEGARARVRIELPLGGYVPTFHAAEPPRAEPPRAEPPRAEPPAPSALGTPAAPRAGADARAPAGPAAGDTAPASAPAPVLAPGPSGGRRRALAAAGAGAALFAGGVLAGRALSGRSAPARPPAPRAVRALWGPWLDDPAGVTICLSNPKTAAVVHAATPDPARERDVVPPGSPADSRFREAFALPAGGVLYESPDTSHGKVLETYAAIRLATLFVTHGAAVRPTQSRLVTWEILRHENVIMLGHEANNRWVLPLLESAPIRIVPPAPHRTRHIAVGHPSKGPPTTYRNSTADDPDRAVEQYALISLLPGAAASRQVALITGLYSPATDMAAEFMTTPETLEELLARLERAAPGRRGPWYFQAVLRTEVRDRLPMRGTIADLRVLAGR